MGTDLVENNLLQVVKELIARVDKLEKSGVHVQEASEIADGLGLFMAGEIRVPFDILDPKEPGEGFSGVRILGEFEYPADSGVYYAIVGINNDALMFGLSAETGAGVFGGGVATISTEGIDLNGLSTAIRHVGTNGANTRTGRLMITLPDDETVPVFAIDITSPSGAELLLNPGFETGDFSNWTKANETNGAWEIDTNNKYDGAYSAKFLSSDVNAVGELVSDRIAVTALSNYLISGYAMGISYGAAHSFMATVSWFNAPAGGALIREDTIGIGTGTTGWLYWDKSFRAPIGASSCEIEFNELASISDMYVCFDSFSVTLVSVAQRLWVSDDGVQCTNGLYPKRLSVLADEFLASGATTNGLTANQRYGSYSYVTTAANGTWFTFGGVLEKGTYTISLLGITNTNCGKTDLYLDDVLIASGDDWYNVAAYNVIKSHAAIAVTYDGYHTVKILVNGKHGSSSSYIVYLTKAWMYQAAD